MKVKVLVYILLAMTLSLIAGTVLMSIIVIASNVLAGARTTQASYPVPQGFELSGSVMTAAFGGWASLLAAGICARLLREHGIWPHVAMGTTLAVVTAGTYAAHLWGIISPILVVATWLVVFYVNSILYRLIRS